MELTIKNYRCFPDTAPVHLKLQNGFVAFIGVNNSGKSSLLKFFHEMRHLFSYLASGSGWQQVFSTGTASFNTILSISDVMEIFCNGNDRDLEISLSLDAKEAPDRTDIRVARDVSLRVRRGHPDFSIITMTEPTIQLQRSQVGVIETRLRRAPSGPDVLELGPMMQAFRDLSRTTYIGAFRNAINVGANSNYFDIQTGQAFITQWSNLKTGNSKDQSQTVYRITETIKKIFGLHDLEINSSSDNSSFQVYADGKVYKLQELGCGLAHFLVVLLNVAIAKPIYVLIDEPEASLHPSLQLEFLTALGALAEKGVLFTTHSIGLARSAADLIYCTVREPSGLSRVHPLEATPRLSELLGELSFSGYRELGYKKILLVEGPKDVKTIQQFLRLVKKDHLIVPISMGGSSLINAAADHQLEELKRLCTDITALIDSERSAAVEPLSEERQGFLAACARAHIRCHVLERRATENYLAESAIKKVKSDKYRALQHYEKLKELSPAWSKEENWRIAREMSIRDLDGTDLGEFLNSI